MARQAVDGRRLRGDASRREILGRATDIASVEGLDGLTLGRLAEETGRSKSSIATLFGSKEALQLAAVYAAAEVFQVVVIEPTRGLPYGTRRIAALMRNALAYSRDRVFSGGCFFQATAADVDSKPGPVRDAVRDWLATWHGYIAAQLRRAAERGELELDELGIERLTFELTALYGEANTRSLVSGTRRPYALAAWGMRDRLAAAGAPRSDLDPLDLVG